MRRTNACYGGEMSAHHYFRDFMYCDSGMIPLLLILELLSRTGRTLGDEVAEMRRDYPSSGEINFRVADPARIVAEIRAHFADRAVLVELLDGLGLEFPDWRFNLRSSNTEPLLRLNVETAGCPTKLWERQEEMTQLIHLAAVSPNQLCCTNRVRDSSREFSVMAGQHEQTDTPDIQDLELANLQRGAEAPRLADDLV